MTDRGFALDDLPLITHDLPIYDHVVDLTTGLLATRGQDYDLRIWNAWKAEKLMDIPATGVRKMPRLSPDGRRVMFVDTNGAALVFEPFTNPQKPLTTLKSGAAFVDAVFSPASEPGLKAATRLADGTVQIWNAETGVALTQAITGPSMNGGFLSLTKDGQWLVGSFADGQIGVWPVPPQTGAVRMMAAQRSSLMTLAPDSKTLVERASDSLTIRFWDLATGMARSEPTTLAEPLSRVPGEPGTVPIGTSHGHEFAFSDDGRRMVAVSHGTFGPYPDQILHQRMEIRLFDTATGRLLHTTSESNVTDHAENLVANLGAMVINTNRLVIRSLATGATLMDRTWPSDAIYTIQFSPAGDRILFALTDRRLIMFDAFTGASLTHSGDPALISHVAGGSGRAQGQTYFMRHGPRLGRLEFSPEGDVFVTGYDDGSYQIWDSFEELPLSEPVKGNGGFVQFSKDGRSILAVSRSGGTGGVTFFSGEIRVIGRDLAAARHRPLTYDGWAPALHFSADGRYGLVGRNGLVIFSPATGEAFRKIDSAETGSIEVIGGISWLITEAWFSPSGDKIVAVCKPDGRPVIKVFETATGKTLHRLPPQDMANPFRVRFAGENRVVVGSFVYNEVAMPLQVWDLGTQKVVAEAKPAQGTYIFDISPDGRRVAVGGNGIALMNTEDLKPIGTVLHHRNPSVGIYCIAFSPDSRRLVTGSMEGTIKVWKAETGELEAEFDRGEGPRWVGFSPDSQRVVAAGHGMYDVPSVANVWEFAAGTTRQVTASVIQPNTIVHTMFSADNRFLMAGDRGGLAQLWDLDTSLPILDPLFVDGASGVSRVGINPQMTRVFALAAGGGQLHHRPLPPRNIVVPDWVPQLAEAVAGQRISDRGALETLPAKDLREVKSLVAQLPAQAAGDNFYAQWARWFFADRSTRVVAPLSSFTVADEANELLAEGSLASLRKAHHISPIDARVFAALARETAAHHEFRAVVNDDPETKSSAEWFANEAVKRAPGSAESHWSQAEVLLRLGKPEAARAALTNAIRLQADNPNVLAIQSELARRDGRTNEAHALLARALNAPVAKPASAYLQLASVARRPDFFAEASLRNRTERRVPGRPSNLPAQFIDLTPWFTGPMGGTETNSAKSAPEFDAPVSLIGAKPFDLRGVVSLSGNPNNSAKPKALVGVPIGQSCARIHFLAHVWRDAPPVRLRVTYADGKRTESLVALASTENLMPISWDNPRPDVVVSAIDIIAQPGNEPVVAAITVQTGPDPVIAAQPQPAYPRITLGQPLELSVAVKTPGSWSYQWSANNKPIAGATNAAFRIASTTARDLASYRVEVRTALSDPANRPVRSAPVWAIDAANPIIRGALKEELFLDIPGNAVEALLKSPKFPSRPDDVANVTAMEAPLGALDNYGRRLSGWLVPKKTASYVFYICSDDASRLSLSPDETSANLAEIARLSGWKEARSWEKLDAESISKPVRLEAGKRYFIEVLHKDGDRGDHVSVAWSKAGQPAPKNGDEPIGAEFLQRPAE